MHGALLIFSRFNSSKHFARLLGTDKTAFKNKEMGIIIQVTFLCARVSKSAGTCGSLACPM